jgi:hypothetical protein
MPGITAFVSENLPKSNRNMIIPLFYYINIRFGNLQRLRPLQAHVISGGKTQTRFGDRWQLMKPGPLKLLN